MWAGGGTRPRGPLLKMGRWRASDRASGRGPPCRRSPGRVRWLLLGTVTPAATVLAGLAFWPLWVRQPGLALSTTLLFAALFSIGVVLLAESGQLLAGAEMIASSVLLVVSWLNEGVVDRSRC